MEKAGIPTATFCSGEFSALGANERAALGMPGLPIVVVPHPVGGIPPEEARALLPPGPSSPKARSMAIRSSGEFTLTKLRAKSEKSALAMRCRAYHRSILRSPESR